jgi:PAS domain S-box-containing protein
MFILDRPIVLNQMENKMNEQTKELKGKIVNCNEIVKVLQESEEKYRTIVHAMNDIIFIFDENNYFTQCFTANRDLLYKASKDFIGRTHQAVMPPNVNKLFEKAAKSVRKTKTNEKYEYFLNINKNKYWFLANMDINEDGKSLVVIITDITKLKKTEQKLKKSEKQLQRLTEHLHCVREKERIGIANEIHDDLGQYLTGLRMDLSWLNTKIPKDNDTLPEKVNSMLNNIDLIIQKVQTISRSLRPDLLDNLNLLAAIKWHSENFEKPTGIKCHIISDLTDLNIEPKRSTMLYRIFQEALTNVARHSKASEVNISLTMIKNSIKLEISDNGLGITVEQINSVESLGIRSMKERAKSFKSKFQIKGKLNEGTKIAVTVKL